MARPHSATASGRDRRLGLAGSGPAVIEYRSTSHFHRLSPREDDGALRAAVDLQLLRRGCGEIGRRIGLGSLLSAVLETARVERLKVGEGSDALTRRADPEPSQRRGLLEGVENGRGAPKSARRGYGEGSFQTANGISMLAAKAVVGTKIRRASRLVWVRFPPPPPLPPVTNCHTDRKI